MPRSTEYRIHKRVLALRAEAENLSLWGGHICIAQFPGVGEV